MVSMVDSTVIITSLLSKLVINNGLLIKGVPLILITSGQYIYISSVLARICSVDLLFN